MNRKIFVFVSLLLAPVNCVAVLNSSKTLPGLEGRLIGLLVCLVSVAFAVTIARTATGSDKTWKVPSVLAVILVLTLVISLKPELLGGRIKDQVRKHHTSQEVRSVVQELVLRPPYKQLRYYVSDDKNVVLHVGGKVESAMDVASFRRDLFEECLDYRNEFTISWDVEVGSDADHVRGADLALFD